MKEKRKRFIVAGLSGAIGGAFGAVSGSTNWVVVACVSALIALISTWLLNGVVK